MSTTHKFLGAVIAGVFLVAASASVVSAQSSQGSASLNLQTASTAELESMLSDLQQQVDDLSQRVSDDRRSRDRDRSRDDNTDDGRNGNRDRDRDGNAERPINFELDEVLDVGSRSQEVRWVQQLLAQHPDIYPEGLVTGYYGNLTSQAVSRLQRQGGFPAVGRVGQQTLDYLQRISDPVGRDRDRDRDRDRGGDDQSSGSCSVAVVREGQASQLDTDGGSVSMTYVGRSAGNYIVRSGGAQYNFTSEGDTISINGETYELLGAHEPGSGSSRGSQSGDGTSLSELRDRVGDGVTIPDQLIDFAFITVQHQCDSGDDSGGQDTVTLTDTYLDTYEFTATLTKIRGSTWRYTVEGTAPHMVSVDDPLQVSADGSDIVATITYGQGSGPETTSEVREVGRFTVDSSISPAEDFSFEVQRKGGSDSGGTQADKHDDQIILERTVGEIDEFPADEIIIGDVNQNGSIEAGDASLVQDYVSGEAELTFRQKVAADVNGDGSILSQSSGMAAPSNNFDDQLILQRTVGQIDEFSAEPVLLGDVNQDGSLTTADASLIQDYVGGNADLTFRQKFAADVNGDGEVTAQGSSEDEANSPTARLELTGQDRPVEVGEELTVNAGQSSDPNGDDLEYQWNVKSPSGQSGGGGFDGQAQISTSFDEAGTAKFEVTVRDEDGNTDTASLEFEITDDNQNGNTAPEAVDDTFSTAEGETINIEESELLSNDSDPDGDSLSTTGAGGESQPENGSLNIRADNGVYQYVPDDGFTGTDSFDYRVSDGNGGFDQATVTIEVGDPEAENQPPTARLSLQRVTHVLPVGYQARSQNHDALINVLNELRGVSVVEPEYDRREIGLNVTRNTSGLFQTIVQQARDRVQEPGERINEPERVGSNEIETGEQFTVDASNSSDPDGNDDNLEYQWEVEAPSGQSGGGGFQDDATITTSFDTAGVANFQVTVRDEDGNTDTASLEFEVGESSNGTSFKHDDELILDRTVGKIDEYPITLGDVNENGEVTATDAEMAAEFVNNEIDLSVQQISAADVNGNGQVTGEDVNEIKSFVTANRRFSDRSDGPGRFPITLGDVNQNGSIEAGDASLVQDYVRGDADLSTQQKAAADVNGDGKVTADVDQSDGGDDDSGDNEDDHNGSVTLTDTFMDTYKFIAVLTPTGENTWRYNITGRLPSPNYDFSATVDGTQLIGVVTPQEGASGPETSPSRGLPGAPQPIDGTAVSASGRLTLDSSETADSIEFDVRESSDSGDDGGSDDSPGDTNQTYDDQLILDRTVGEISEFPAQEIILGDVTQDGSVTTQDALLIQDYVDGEANLNFRQKAAADVDGDGKITTSGSDQNDDNSDTPVRTPVGPDMPRLPGGVLVR